METTTLEIKPLGDKVLLRRIMPPQHPLLLRAEWDGRAEVLAVGRGKWIKGQLQPLDVQVGQIVRVPLWKDDPLMDTEDMLMVREQELFGVEV